MNQQSSDCRDWEKVFVAQNHDAAVGRLFKGIIHNMNGDIQALSMQSELFAMMFGQFDEAFAKSVEMTGPGESRQLLENAQNLLRRRASLLPQMQQAVRSLKETVRGAANFGENLDVKTEYSSVKAILRSTEKLLCADSFFKHKVERDLRLADSLPPVQSHHVELGYVFYVLLANALEALKKKQEPPWTVMISTGVVSNSIEIVVEDNGIGIAPEDQKHIFEPFFSTWPGGAGLGLYLARQVVMQIGGRIGFESVPGCTRFQISLPVDKL